MTSERATRPGREDEAYVAGRLAGYEEGLAAPREGGWEELRREIEALPTVAEWDERRGKVGAPRWRPAVSRSAVLALLRLLAAARGEPGLNWEELRREIEARDTATLLDPEYVVPPDAVDTGIVRAYDRRALLRLLAAARGEPGLDVERLAIALARAMGWTNVTALTPANEAWKLADRIAAEYAA